MKKALHRTSRKAKRPGTPAVLPSSRPAPKPAPKPEVATPTQDGFAAAVEAHRKGDLVQAEAGYREILRLKPDHPHANNNLAILLRATRRTEEALERYRAAIRLAPEDSQILSNLGCALVDLRRFAEAADHLRRALTLRPDYAEALFNLGNVLRELGNTEGSRTAYTRALLLRPNMAEAHANLGDLHKNSGALGTAVDCFVTALRHRPDMPEPCNNLGEALKEQGRLEEAIAVFQEGLKGRPDSALMHSNLLFALHYTPAVPPDIIFRAHLNWGERHARPLLPVGRGFPNDRAPGRRLRVGYVSPDFCAHSCSYFSEPLIREHDRSAVEVFCYMTAHRDDIVTRRFEAMADHWRMVAGLDDAGIAAQIERDRIDILVDLAGHTGGSRLLVFARKPAPVQVTWLGYPDTTGMRAMDFRLTDAVADPEHVADARHSERLVRLPLGFLAFQPMVDPGPCAPAPVHANGHVTFGSFNNISKVTPEVIRVWSEILKRVPGSRLIIKSKPLGDPPTRDRYARLFAANGIDAERFDLMPRIEPAENHLRAYDRIDIALDPFPYNGTTTTCEALWMGVPVLTIAGTHHVARVGASLLTHGGLPELVAPDEAGYIARAAELAGDRARLDAYRGGLRERLRASPLGNYTGFARQVEAAYRAMWHDWLARTPA